MFIESNSERMVQSALDYFFDENGVGTYETFSTRYLAIPRKIFAHMAFQLARVPPTDILEIGAGSGELLTYIETNISRGREVRLVGIDPSDVMTNRRKNSRVKVGNFHTYSQDIETESVDLVLSYSNFRFWSNPVSDLEDISRILRPGGMAYILDLRRDIALPLRESMVTFVGKFRDFLNTQILSAYTADEISDIVARTNMGAVAKLRIGGLAGIEPNSRQVQQIMYQDSQLAKLLFDAKNSGLAVPNISDSAQHLFLLK